MWVWLDVLSDCNATQRATRHGLRTLLSCLNTETADPQGPIPRTACDERASEIEIRAIGPPYAYLGVFITNVVKDWTLSGEPGGKLLSLRP